MKEINLLLTDEFVQFSNKIAELYAEIKTKKQELKALVEEAEKASADWENWKATKKSD